MCIIHESDCTSLNVKKKALSNLTKKQLMHHKTFNSTVMPWMRYSTLFMQKIREGMYNRNCDGFFRYNLLSIKYKSLRTYSQKRNALY